MLYNQDVDMGVSRDLYDPLYHEKQQKQLETQKQERDEMVMNKLKEVRLTCHDLLSYAYIQNTALVF